MGMEKNVGTTSSSMQNAEERGAGGKLRRPTPRRPPATPYARPQQNQSQRSGWLSKVVDPACRLIAGGAARIFPYLFSNSPDIRALPALDIEKQDHDPFDADLKHHDGGGDHNWTVHHSESGFPGVAGPSKTADRSDVAPKQSKMGLINDDELSAIEKLMEGKKFSRDEVDHLLEIINSRAVDPRDADQENKYPGLTRKEEKEAVRPVVTPEDSRRTEEKQEDVNRVLLATSTPLLQSSMADEVGASPIEIARAYMGSRTSDVNHGSKSLMSKDERFSLHRDGFPSKLLVPSPSLKPSTCWPGAILRDQRGYLSPQIQRGRSGLHNFPRTPYSRTIYSKAKSQLNPLQDGSSMHRNISSTSFQQLQTPSHGLFSSRKKEVDNEHGSVGPIRRIQHRVVAETPSKESIYFRSPLNVSSQLENSSVSKSIFPAVEKNLELGGTIGVSISESEEGKRKCSAVGNQTVHPHSSQMARTILDHLERNLPTPKDKAAELKLVTSWRKSQCSDVADVMANEQNNLPCGESFDFKKYINQAEQKNSAQFVEDRGNSSIKVPQSLFKVPFPSLSSNNESNDALNKSSSSSNAKYDGTVTAHINNLWPSFKFSKTEDSRVKTAYEDAAKIAVNAASPKMQDLQKPPSSLGTKPVLPSISVGRPEQRWTFPSDNTAGFTFPVSSSGASSEPPTPSIMPTISASVLHQPTEKHDICSYSFGSKRSIPALVFSFPSTSSASNHDEVSDVKFSFGSDKTTRISFSSLGKDAICC
ncbi:nuclear pore complex protein NUP1 [Carica papaya]|uniref:nuclear pore complex protein NUP1 n=1 Tax=Carica papaya TaxID=3649 RepID=UPI000B8CB271|nr:nuclear pore complex protein NUP1 [Carica papaya]XP_021899200.1 nuclear pore complex protein NUP1 [Carica papaya]XP_021899201.1 nuclear pore complex protein NUP1 [Carica papaya]XP_021899202.1 nuclear pore complex protein NUP1 [Carica papaya]XP_021899204.1 nuclear pore complex protein NUP1 [Carica papaya]